MDYKTLRNDCGDCAAPDADKTEEETKKEGEEGTPAEGETSTEENA